MPELLHPGVYVQEVSSGVRPIEGVSTSTAAFIGVADKGLVPQILPSGQRIQPVMVTSFSDYVRQFGGFRQDSFLTYAVRSFYDNGGSRLYVVRVIPADARIAGIGTSASARLTSRFPAALDSLLNIVISNASNGNPNNFDLRVYARSLTEMVEIEKFASLEFSSADTTINSGVNASKFVQIDVLAARPGNGLGLAVATSGANGTGSLAIATTPNPNGIQVEATIPGTWANTNLVVSIDKASDGNADNFNLIVKLNNIAVEAFRDVTFNPGTPPANYARTVINSSSQYITIPSDLTVRPTNGETALAGGTDTSGIATVWGTSSAIPITAANEGEWGNKIWVGIRDSSDGDSNHFNLLVGYGTTQSEANSNIVETFSSVTFHAPTSAAPIPENDVAAQVNGRSEYIRITNPVTVRPLDVPLQQLSGSSDGTASNIDLLGDESNGKGLYALDKITDVNLIAIPGAGDAKTISAGMGYCKNKRQLQDCFFIGDVGLISVVGTARTVGTQPSIVRVSDARGFALNGDASGALDKAAGDYGAIYYPWVLAADPIGVGRNPRILLPPSGFVAGIYARTDNTRGVFKAPAGTDAGVSGALATATMVGDLEQDTLNPVGVNAIRTVPGSGIVVWGTRTIGSNAEWRYIPVRRMAIFLRVSIYYGIQWAVFEPNDEPLWASLRLNIRSFMLTQFRAGAFQGRTPDEAFFVKCDSTTTTQQDIDLGIVNILVGFAPLKPAEFIVLKLSQKVNQPAA